MAKNKSHTVWVRLANEWPGSEAIPKMEIFFTQPVLNAEGRCVERGDITDLYVAEVLGVADLLEDLPIKVEVSVSDKGIAKKSKPKRKTASKKKGKRKSKAKPKPRAKAGVVEGPQGTEDHP